jgi:hypothetical protein
MQEDRLSAVASGESLDPNRNVVRPESSIRLLGSLWEAKAELSTLEIETLATQLEAEIVDTAGDTIESLYAELRALVDQDDTAANQVSYRQLVARLRRLQEIEAVEMDRFFEEHRLLRKGAGRDALKRADDLLAKYENIASSNASGKRTLKTRP